MNTAQQQIWLWREDLRRLVMDCFKPDKIEPFQEELLLACSGQDMPKVPRIAMPASKGPGKTTGLAWVGLGAMMTRLHLNGVGISITGENLRDNLWKEIAKWHNRSEIFKRAFTWTAKRYFATDHPATWWLSARAWKKSASPEEQADTLSGLHNDNVLVLGDETGGWPSAVMATADAVLSSCIWGLIIQAGNPTHLEGPLYEAVKVHPKFWKIIPVNGDPDSPTRASRVSVEWAKQQIEKYGKDNPWVLVNVYGQFPPSSINALLGPEDVEDAFKRWGAIKENDINTGQKRIGCDVARFGDDANVFFPRQGLIALNPVIVRNQRGHALATRVMTMEKRWGGNVVLFVDDTGGYGATLIDSLIQGGRAPIPVNFSGKAIDPRYENKRAENYWNMAEWVLRGGSLPNVPGLKDQLTKTHYTFTKKDKLILEPKDVVKAALGGMSPDEADALSLTFTNPEDIDTQTDEGRELFAGAGAGRLVQEEDDD